MEPIPFEKIVWTLSMIQNNPLVSNEDLTSHLAISERRIKDILRELLNMRLIERCGSAILLTNTGSRLLLALEKRKWELASQIIEQAAPQYQIVIKVLKRVNKGLRIVEILNLSSDSQTHIDEIGSLNQVIIETCLEWGQRLGVVQRYLQSKERVEDRYYKIIGPCSCKLFFKYLEMHYSTILRKSGKIRMRGGYVPIVDLREDVCEALKITRTEFDERLKEAHKKHPGFLEFTGAPITSKARKTIRGQIGLSKVKEVDVGLLLRATRVHPTGIRFGKRTYEFLALHTLSGEIN